MTTLVANSSGRSGGGKSVRKNQTSNASHSGGDHISQKDNEKFQKQPTAEQMRIVNWMSDKKDPDSELKPKIDQIVELTGASREDAAVALYDCDNDMGKAIEMILDGEALESEWQSTGKKKKQKNPSAPVSTGASGDQPASANVNGQKNGDERKFDKSRRERTNGFEENGSGEYKGVENGRSHRGKRDPNYKPRERRGGAFAGSSLGYSRTQDSEEGSEDKEYIGEGGAPRRGGFSARGRGGGIAGRGRGAQRGRGGGRGGARTYSGRGTQSSDKPADEVLSSIETWTNEPKPEEGTEIGNWSELVKGHEWAPDNWSESLDSKAFNLSGEKNGPPTSAPDSQKPASNAPTQMSFLSAASKSIEKTSQPQSQVPQQSQPSTQSSSFATISSIPNKRTESLPQQPSHPQHATSQPQQQQQQQSQSKQPSQNQVNAGRALLSHIQQPQQQAPNLKSQTTASALGMNLYNKNATESLKSLVGLSGNSINESLSGDMSKQSSNARTNSNAQNQRSKQPDSAVEMPSNDIANVTLSFGSLEFDPLASNTASNFSNMSSAQDNIFEAPPQKSDKNLNSLMDQNQQNQPAFRSPAQSAQKTGMGLGDVLISDKMNAASNNYSKKNDYNIMGGYGKNSYSSDGYNSGTPGYNHSQPHSHHLQPAYYNNQFNLMAASGNFNSYGNNPVNSVPLTQQAVKDGNVSQQQSVASGSVTATSAAPNSLGLMSNSTNTTNVLKNTLPATGKGVHNSNNANLPPGVQNFPQAPVSLPTQYVTNNGIPVPYMPFAFDYGRESNIQYSNYNSELKPYRGSEQDNGSSGPAVGVQSIPNQQNAHNQGAFLHNMGHNSIMSYFYPQATLTNYPQFPYQPMTTGANTGFPAKTPAQPSYNAHSYPSGYENLGSGPVAGGNAGTSNVGQTQQDYNMKPYGQQQMSHTKTMQGNSGSDLSGSNQGNTNGQSMYNKQHSQINKSFDNKNVYQQGNQFIGGSNGMGYGNGSFLLPQQQAMHLPGDQSGGPQIGGAGGAQRSMKGNVGGAQNASFNNKPWN